MLGTALWVRMFREEFQAMGSQPLAGLGVECGAWFLTCRDSRDLLLHANVSGHFWNSWVSWVFPSLSQSGHHFFLLKLQGISLPDIFDLSPDQLLGNTSENVGTTSSWWLVIRVSLASQLLEWIFLWGCKDHEQMEQSHEFWIWYCMSKIWCQKQNRDIQIEMAQPKRGTIEIYSDICRWIADWNAQIEMLPLII